MVPIALATDGGGATRRPASHAGLVGLKPTTGRIARGQGFPVILHDLEVIGTIARDTADTSAMMDLLAGPDPRDQQSLAYPQWSRTDVSRPLRILYIRTFGGAPIDPEIESRVREATSVLAKLGHEIHEVADAPFDFSAASHAFTVIAAAGLAWMMRSRLDQAPSLTPSIQAMLNDAQKLTAADYADTLIAARELKRALSGTFETYDLLLTPAAAALPWPAAETNPKTIAGQAVGPRGHAFFTPFANLAGCPGITLPCLPSQSGLPIGVQLVGPWGRDELLVSIGSAYEAAQPWHDRRMVLDIGRSAKHSTNASSALQTA
jgi:aspartyl-tRNA(Asn)/glutamyl-tRNA(Gln) amidotransferase subunit A